VPAWCAPREEKNSVQPPCGLRKFKLRLTESTCSELTTRVKVIVNEAEKLIRIPSKEIKSCNTLASRVDRGASISEFNASDYRLWKLFEARKDS